MGLAAENRPKWDFLVLPSAHLLVEGWGKIKEWRDVGSIRIFPYSPPILN